MSTFFPTGSSENKIGSVIMQVGATTRSDIVDIKSGHSHQKGDNKALVNADQNTILQTSTSAVVSITGVDGYVAVELGAPPTAGTNLNVVGASYPFSRVYNVLNVSGNYALTSTPYVSCTGIGTNGTYSVNTGDFDPNDSGQFIIMGHTTELAGQVNDALACHKSNSSESLHPFGSYRSRVYSSCWECYGNSGVISPCDVTTTVVTLDPDHALNEDPTVIMGIGLKMQAADLTNPDTTGLRDPS